VWFSSFLFFLVQPGGGSSSARMELSSDVLVPDNPLGSSSAGRLRFGVQQNQGHSPPLLCCREVGVGGKSWGPSSFHPAPGERWSPCCVVGRVLGRWGRSCGDSAKEHIAVMQMSSACSKSRKGEVVGGECGAASDPLLLLPSVPQFGSGMRGRDEPVVHP